VSPCVLSSLQRDLHASMLIVLSLRRAIGNSNLGRFHVLWQMADPTRRWHSDYACNFAHADRQDSELLLVWAHKH
jgi:hypothetical protein